MSRSVICWTFIYVHLLSIMNLPTGIFDALHQFYCSIILLYKAAPAYGRPQCDLCMSEDSLININIDIFSYRLYSGPKIHWIDIKCPLNYIHNSAIKIKKSVLSSCEHYMNITSLLNSEYTFLLKKLETTKVNKKRGTHVSSVIEQLGRFFPSRFRVKVMAPLLSGDTQMTGLIIVSSDQRAH